MKKELESEKGINSWLFKVASEDSKGCSKMQTSSPLNSWDTEEEKLKGQGQHTPILFSDNSFLFASNVLGPR